MALPLPCVKITPTRSCPWSHRPTPWGAAARADQMPYRMEESSKTNATTYGTFPKSKVTSGLGRTLECLSISEEYHSVGATGRPLSGAAAPADQMPYRMKESSKRNATTYGTFHKINATCGMGRTLECLSISEEFHAV